MFKTPDNTLCVMCTYIIPTRYVHVVTGVHFQLLPIGNGNGRFCKLVISMELFLHDLHMQIHIDHTSMLHTYIPTHMCTYIRTHIHVYIHTYINVYTHGAWHEHVII